MKKNMKIYVLTLSRVFPTTHPRKGEPTGFKEKFERGQEMNRYPLSSMIEAATGINEPIKIHTIRANYELWRKRFDEIEAGRACLSVRQWTGKPYASSQVEIARLTQEDGIGLQKLKFLKKEWLKDVDGIPIWFDIDGITYGHNLTVMGHETLANNDGLTLSDWREWFKPYDLSKPMAIIHFANFRY